MTELEIIQKLDGIIADLIKDGLHDIAINIEIEKQKVAKELQPKKLSWAEAILEVEGLVNAEVSDLRKKGNDSIADLLLKSMNVIKRGH